MVFGNIHLLGRDIPIYGICFFGGMLLAAAVAAFLRRRRAIEGFDLVSSAVYTFIGALIGSKLLFIAVSIDDIIKYNIPPEAYIKGGFVFYGGLIGGAAGLLIYVRQFGENPRDYFDLYATCLPLGHALGRVGCFFGGCCYGIPYDGPLHIVYHSSATSTPIGTPLLPVQLIEAAILCIVFVLMLILFLKRKGGTGNLSLIYLAIYSVIRFILEFFRGDKIRGVLILSTSQWISLALFITVTIILMVGRRRHSTQNS